MERGSPSSNNNRSAHSSSVLLQAGSPSQNNESPRTENIDVEIEKQDLPPTKNEELCLPIRNLTRIMRRALPLYAKISQDAKATTQLCVSDFMGIITTEAVEKCNEESRKIISGEDIIRAMGRLGFEDYVGPLSLLLQNYRNHEAQFSGMSTACGFNMDGSGTGGSSSGNGQY
ncbi:transcriptional activator hap3 [Medicago truncatula]|uniref:Nuclear transcription factor Y protein n=2 Tax=Medicago truncatula TaxID=3880 RepID=A0A072VGA7_MEDTR|nr:transcriptional activator hap3 [Medicago truncatula]KEH40448.1 nuclear transcription factor Y protein [Medicago truncatula]